MPNKRMLFDPRIGSNKGMLFYPVKECNNKEMLFDPVNFVKLFRAPFLLTQTYEGMKYCQLHLQMFFKTDVLNFFKISQRSRCAGASFLIQLQV